MNSTARMFDNNKHYNQCDLQLKNDINSIKHRISGFYIV
jgi:hypothetical protein